MNNLNTETTGFSQRLKLARISLELSQSEFAIRSDVGGSTYQKYELGTSKPGCDAMEGFARLGINCNWLLTGGGEMFLSTEIQHNFNLSVDMGVLKVIIAACKQSLGESFLKLDMDEQLNFATSLYHQFKKIMNTLKIRTEGKNALRIDDNVGLVIRLNDTQSKSVPAHQEKPKLEKVKLIYDKRFDF